MAEFSVSPELEDRIELLAERANEGLLSEEESAEYEALIDAMDLIAIKSRRPYSSCDPTSSPI